MYSYKTMSSPIGKLTLVASNSALVALYVKNEEMPKKTGAFKDENHKVLKKTEKQLREYFEGLRREFNLPLDPEGTDFQARVWGALTKIPYGKVWSYGEQAKFLKAPNAQRAVGGANGKNPIPIIIPCHRVIGSTGKLTGFAGGMEMKIFLLKLEGHEVDPHGLKLLLNNQLGFLGL
ncbi:MAG: methylated-DNA--[protein]-cysteine S-methyltransferase [Bdellovibrionales bacterium]|nr:methylated-DNA--[protein]-cysteine S-methyltransferase [Bdellovibrionales bacterium]